MNLVAQLEKGAFGVIRKTIGAVLRNGLVGLIIGVVLAEVGGVVLDQSPKIAFLGGTFVQVAAVAFGLALAFAFAMTTALVEGIRGIVTALRDVESEAKQTLGAGVRDVGHEAGNIVQSVEQHK